MSPVPIATIHASVLAGIAVAWLIVGLVADALFNRP
jgi:hypothetical protein